MKYDIKSIRKRKENMIKVKRIVDIFLVIAIYNIVLVSISCINKIEPISIMGYRAYIITSNSMEPTIKKGDVLITKKISENNIKIDDIVTFKKNEEIITHRIAEIEETSEGKIYKTKGDNNNIEDTEKISYNEIEGEYLVRIPKLGNILLIFENKILFLVMILIFLILHFYAIQLNERKDKRREKKEKYEREKMGK